MTRGKKQGIAINTVQDQRPYDNNMRNNMAC